MICPVVREQVADLAKLSCDHLISKAIWEGLTKRGLARCPICRKDTKLGDVLPTKKINAAIKDIEGDVMWMKRLLPWKADMTEPRPGASSNLSAESSDLLSGGPRSPGRPQDSHIILPSAPPIGSVKSDEAPTHSSPTRSRSIAPTERRGSVISLIDPNRYEIKADPPLRFNTGRSGCQDVALSPTCHSLSIVHSDWFTILSISDNHTKIFSEDHIIRSCVGHNNGQYGDPDMPLSRGTAFRMPFIMAALNDERLCIICHSDRNHFAVFNARTGEFIRCTKVQHPCHKILMAPKGEILALALESGELLVYASGPNGNLNTSPISVVKRKAQPAQKWLVKCMAITADSTHISVCSTDDIIRTYHLNVEINKVELLSIYDPELSYPTKNHGICNMALSPTPPFLINP